MSFFFLFRTSKAANRKRKKVKEERELYKKKSFSRRKRGLALLTKFEVPPGEIHGSNGMGNRRRPAQEHLFFK